MDDSRDQDGKTEEGFVSNYLLYLLAAASHAASTQFHAEVEEAGLKVVEWRVLACLVDRDGQMITRLARFALYEQSRLTRIIEKMEDRDLVLRRPDTEDRRKVRVFLSQNGRTVAEKLVLRARVHEARLLQDTANAQGADLKSRLKSLIRLLETETRPDERAD